MSFLSLSRWRPAHLFLTWAIYWLALLAVALGPAIPPVLRATAPNAKGEISATVGDSGLNLIVKEFGRVTWSGSVHLLTAALWLALPPLVLWALWVMAGGSQTREAIQAGR